MNSARIFAGFGPVSPPRVLPANEPMGKPIKHVAQSPL